MPLRKVTVRDYMSATQLLLKPDMDILQAIHQLVGKHQPVAPVVDEHGNLVGILSEKDCMKIALRAGYHEELGGRVSEYMQTSVESVDANTTIMELAELFVNKPYRFYPVVDDAEVVGQISCHEVLKGLEQIW